MLSWQVSEKTGTKCEMVKPYVSENSPDPEMRSNEVLDLTPALGQIVGRSRSHKCDMYQIYMAGMATQNRR